MHRSCWGARTILHKASLPRRDCSLVLEEICQLFDYCNLIQFNFHWTKAGVGWYDLYDLIKWLKTLHFTSQLVVPLISSKIRQQSFELFLGEMSKIFFCMFCSFEIEYIWQSGKLTFSKSRNCPHNAVLYQNFAQYCCHGHGLDQWVGHGVSHEAAYGIK